MLRIIAIQLLLFLTPFVVAGLFMYFTRPGFALGHLVERDRFFWLSCTGLGLVIAGFITLGAFSGAEPGQTYVPAREVDGEIQPGYFE
ncbi:MAG: DUF6111 family protein [Pseudomonadota bacterium]